MLRCGLLGETLGHSYSPAIHALLGDYEYRLFEKSPDALGDFLANGEWDGLNVTIPYKKSVVPYCAELSETARALGSVNTLVRRKDGSIYGDNTDFYGFRSMAERSGVAVSGEKALVLGSGGASVTVCAVLRELGAREVVVISRSGENNYNNLDRHADAGLIVNTTPVGMYPKNGTAPLDLSVFPALRGVLDIVYNPARTALLLQAETLSLPHMGGLHMLVAQAARSSALFTGTPCEEKIDSVERAIADSLQNIALIGMPGCGKSTAAKALGEALGRPVFEADALIEEAAGKPIPAIFRDSGEAGFRKIETDVLAELGKRSGAVISTGGGCVTRAENYPLLHQNGIIVWLRRDLDKLAREGRPLSLGADLGAMYAVREPLYARFADHTVDNSGTPEQSVDAILEVLK